MAGKGRLATAGGVVREREIAAIALRHIDRVKIEGPALVIGDLDGHVERALATRGVKTSRWARMCVGQTRGQAWPEAGPFAVAFLRLPRNKDVLEMSLHAAAWALAPGAQLLVYGANDEGIKSASKRIAGVFGAARKLDNRNRCRLLAATRPPASTPRAPLSAWREEIDSPLPALAPGGWVSYPGVFARGALDDGTALLLESLPPFERGAALDFACGGGVMARALMARGPSLEVHMLEADAVALEAARENAPGATAHLSDAWTHAPRRPFDVIVSNPPIHRGKSEDFNVLRALLERAPEFLKPGGELWFVIQRQVPVKELMSAFAHVDLTAEDNRFRIWRAIAPGGS